jgi:hypothetical protein
VNEYGCRVLTERDRRKLYESKLDTEAEDYLHRVAKAIPVQKAVAERLKQIPRHRALVVIAQQAKSNVVQLPSGEPVQVEWRRPKLSIAR